MPFLTSLGSKFTNYIIDFSFTSNSSQSCFSTKKFLEYEKVAVDMLGVLLESKAQKQLPLAFVELATECAQPGPQCKGLSADPTQGPAQAACFWQLFYL